MIHIHEIKFEEKDDFSKQLNICSDIFQQMMRDDISEEEYKTLSEDYLVERWRLETGSY